MKKAPKTTEARAVRPAGRGREEDGLSVVAIRRDAEEGEEASGGAEERARNQNNLEMRSGERVPLYISGELP